MKLLSLKLENFQGISNLTFDFIDGCSASIYGDNATGKTTVFNAITWLLFDKASTAAKNFTPKTKGPGGDLHHLEHSVDATFKVESGRIVTLKKTYKEVYKKKRGSAREEFDGHTIEYTIDGVPAKEKEFSSTITTFCGDQENMKMLTMPDYFSEQLAWDARRKILLEICGDISDDEIMASSNELKELPDFLRMPGTEEQYYSVDEYRKIAASKKAEINKQLGEIPGRIDEAHKAIPDTDDISTGEVEASIQALTQKKEKLMGDKTAVTSGGTATAELRKSIADNETLLAQERTAHVKQQAEINSDIDTEILLAKREESEARRESEDAELDAKRAQSQRDNMVAIRKKLLEDYQTINEMEWDVEQEVCPTCHRNLPSDQIEKMREDYNLKKSKKLEDINLRGQKEASKNAIAELDNKISAFHTKAEETEKRYTEAISKQSLLDSKRTAAMPFESTDKYAEITAKTAEYRAKIEDESKCTSEAVVAIETKIKAINEAIQDEQDKRMQITIKENQNRRIAELERQEKRISGEYEELEKGLYLCDIFVKTKVGSLTERINRKFKSVRFRLFQEQLNGGVKEDCEVMIPRTDGSMVPYAFANNAARINAGLEIISTLSEHWKIQMPVFIDNAESVTHLENMSTQTIRLVVSEPDKKLRMEVQK